MEKSAYIQMAETEQQHWWFSGRRTILENLIAQHFTGRTTPHILEIGAGTGGNLSMLRKFGSVSAVEMDNDARQIANAKTGIDVLPGSLPDKLPAFPGQFDLICLFDVLEHVENDVGSLAAIRELLAPGGLLLVTVPAHPWLWGRHDEMLHHKRRYTRESLQTVVSNAGLTVRRLCFFNTFLFPFAVIGRILDRLSTRGSSSGSDMPPPFVNSVLTRVFSLEAGLVARFNLPLGVSLLAMLERP